MKLCVCERKRVCVCVFILLGISYKMQREMAFMMKAWDIIRKGCVQRMAKMKIDKCKRKSVKLILKLFWMQSTSSHENITNWKSFARTQGKRNLRVENAGWEYHWLTQWAKQRGQTCTGIAERMTNDQEVERKHRKNENTEEKYCIQSFLR